MRIYKITVIRADGAVLDSAKEGGNKKFPPFYKINLDKLYAGMI